MTDKQEDSLPPTRAVRSDPHCDCDEPQTRPARRDRTAQEPTRSNATSSSGPGAGYRRPAASSRPNLPNQLSPESRTGARPSPRLDAKGRSFQPRAVRSWVKNQCPGNQTRGIFSRGGISSIRDSIRVTVGLLRVRNLGIKNRCVLGLMDEMGNFDGSFLAHSEPEEGNRKGGEIPHESTCQPIALPT
ncbi:hypothetical protein CRG98_048514 [Punica granatum]|uniref:Uncharacterized protein n=1 Tax=Punica granatum TaxID=22663 RepID=A0A2I0HHD3_PUNGR|nr:hypothetical protein CRG98_048514 [Punica granatum]